MDSKVKCSPLFLKIIQAKKNEGFQGCLPLHLCLPVFLLPLSSFNCCLTIFFTSSVEWISTLPHRGIAQVVWKPRQTIIQIEGCPVSDNTKTNLFFVYTPLPLTKLPLEIYISILTAFQLFVTFFCFATDKRKTKHPDINLGRGTEYRRFFFFRCDKILPKTMSNLFSRKSRWLCSLYNRLYSLMLL